MSKAEQFRLYADEAMRGAVKSKSENEKEALFKLARTWDQAASLSESTIIVNNEPSEPKAP
jgi:hypothetical protein